MRTAAAAAAAAASYSTTLLVWWTNLLVVAMSTVAWYNTMATAIAFAPGGVKSILSGTEVIDGSLNVTEIPSTLPQGGDSSDEHRLEPNSVPAHSDSDSDSNSDSDSHLHSHSHSLDSVSKASRIRAALRGDFPEIDRLCSDDYLESVASVPGRSLEYAIHQKVRGSLEWRRSYGVDALRAAFVCLRGESAARACAERFARSEGHYCDRVVVVDEIFVPVALGGPASKEPLPTDESNSNESSDDSNSDSTVAIHSSEERNENENDNESGKENETENGNENNKENGNENNKENENGNEAAIGERPFVPTPALLEVCASGAFVVGKEEWVEERTAITRGRCRRLVVRADTSRLNWWQTGVEAGLLYHVLVLEEAFERIRTENSQRRSLDSDNENENKNGPLSESIVVLVDTTGAPLLPPPLSVPRGMVQLLRKAYPDRIHRIYVGPVHPWLRTLYNYLASTLKPRTRDKIVLLTEAPCMEDLSLRGSNHTETDAETETDAGTEPEPESGATGGE